MRAAAVSDDKIIVIASDGRDLALVDATSGSVLKRRQGEQYRWLNHAIVDNGRKLITFGAHPALEVFDARDLSLICRFDEIHIRGKSGRLIRTDGYYVVGEKPGRLFHSPALEEEYRSFEEAGAWNSFKSNLIENNDGTILLPVLARTYGADRRWRYRLCRVDYSNGNIEIVSEFVPDEALLRRPWIPEAIVHPDGSAGINLAPASCLAFSGPQIASPRPMIIFANYDSSKKGGELRADRDRRFASHLSLFSTTEIVASEFSARSCGEALRGMTRLIQQDFEGLIWGERLEFHFIVGETRHDEGEFFRELMERQLLVRTELKDLLDAYINQATRGPGRRYLKNLSPSVAVGDYPVIPALGPALRTLLVLDPESIQIFKSFAACVDLEHDTYLRSVVLMEYARKRGWAEDAGFWTCVHYLLPP